MSASRTSRKNSVTKMDSSQQKGDEKASSNAGTASGGAASVSS